MDLPQVRLSGKLNLHPVGNPGFPGSHGGEVLLRWSGQTIRIGQVRHRADRLIVSQSACGRPKAPGRGWPPSPGPSRAAFREEARS
jgi:hypothetical protein